MLPSRSGIQPKQYTVIPSVLFCTCQIRTQQRHGENITGLGTKMERFCAFRQTFFVFQQTFCALFLEIFCAFEKTFDVIQETFCALLKKDFVYLRKHFVYFSKKDFVHFLEKDSLYFSKHFVCFSKHFVDYFWKYFVYFSKHILHLLTTVSNLVKKCLRLIILFHV